jgi:pimeloyl-ACP methyl ester carboxylesterase
VTLPSDQLTATLVTADGVRLDAGHHPGDHGPGGPGVVVAHGLAGSRRTPAMRRAVHALARVAGVVSFDFRGHGRSGGASTVGDREVLDLAAAVAWARELGHGPVATVGFSMGAAVALRHAAEFRDVTGVVAVSGPARWYYRGTPPMRWVHRMISTAPGRLVARTLKGTRIASAGWDPVPEPPDTAAARLAPIPLLVVHGDADPLFPVEHAEALYAAAGEPRQLWIVPGLGHAPDGATDELLDRIAGWLGAHHRAGAD